MNPNQEIYYDAVPETNHAMVPAPAFGTALQSITNSRPNSHFNRKATVRAENTFIHEGLRTGLAGEAIKNVANLCVLGEAVVQAVPSAREPVGMIIRAHASSSAERIVRW